MMACVTSCLVLPDSSSASSSIQARRRQQGGCDRKTADDARREGLLLLLLVSATLVVASFEINPPSSLELRSIDSMAFTESRLIMRKSHSFSSFEYKPTQRADPTGVYSPLKDSLENHQTNEAAQQNNCNFWAPKNKNRTESLIHSLILEKLSDNDTRKCVAGLS